MKVMIVRTVARALESVTVSATDGDVVFFKPTSATATIPLYEDGPVGADDEYMVFGYWRKDPASAAGPYQFEPFAQAFGGGTTTFSGDTSATYGGIAVGAYVEKDPTTAVDTYRQGEFTATVNLRATSSTEGVFGTIGDFVTTPVGGSTAPTTAARWIITLLENNIVSLGQTTDAGRWKHEYLETRGTESTPPAVVGVFDARDGPAMAPAVLAIVGAFGATKH